MSEDIAVGERTTYYRYPIEREGKSEYRVEIYADDFEAAKDIINRCLAAGIIEWPKEKAGRLKKEG